MYFSNNALFDIKEYDTSSTPFIFLRIIWRSRFMPFPRRGNIFCIFWEIFGEDERLCQQKSDLRPQGADTAQPPPSLKKDKSSLFFAIVIIITSIWNNIHEKKIDWVSKVSKAKGQRRECRYASTKGRMNWPRCKMQKVREAMWRMLTVDLPSTHQRRLSLCQADNFYSSKKSLNFFLMNMIFSEDSNIG